MSRANKRLYEQLVQACVVLIPELIEADDHIAVAVPGLIPVGFEKPIPPGQIESVVGVGLLRVPGMVHPVHVWSDDDPTQ